MSDSLTSFVLLVERGQTRFPERPVDRDRYLIGAGSNCQLQLGGEMPILHSIIVPEGDHLWIDAVVPNPPLIVNGNAVRESELHVGDVLEIGEFVFSVAIGRVSQARALPQPSSALSANELVDALEAELKAAEEIDSARAAGAAALLAAAESVTASPSSPTDGLNRMLQERSRDLDRREAALQAVAEKLERAQQDLQRQIALLAEQLGREPSTVNPLKISA